MRVLPSYETKRRCHGETHDSLRRRCPNPEPRRTHMTLTKLTLMPLVACQMRTGIQVSTVWP